MDLKMSIIWDLSDEYISAPVAGNLGFEAIHKYKKGISFVQKLKKITENGWLHSLFVLGKHFSLVDIWGIIYMLFTCTSIKGKQQHLDLTLGCV